MTFGMICKYMIMQNAGSAVSRFTCQRGSQKRMLMFCSERARDLSATHRRPPPLALDFSHRTRVELLCNLGINRSNSSEDLSHASHADLRLGSGDEAWDRERVKRLELATFG